jgi:hypothetical protein
MTEPDLDGGHFLGGAGEGHRIELPEGCSDGTELVPHSGELPAESRCVRWSVEPKGMTTP